MSSGQRLGCSCDVPLWKVSALSLFIDSWAHFEQLVFHFMALWVSRQVSAGWSLDGTRKKRLQKMKVKYWFVGNQTDSFSTIFRVNKWASSNNSSGSNSSIFGLRSINSLVCRLKLNINEVFAMNSQARTYVPVCDCKRRHFACWTSEETEIVIGVLFVL